MRPKPFVAYGPGFSGDYDTEDEARAVVGANGAGGVYRLLATHDGESCEHGIDGMRTCEGCDGSGFRPIEPEEEE